jgi:hypothetical protein
MSNQNKYLEGTRLKLVGQPGIIPLEIGFSDPNTGQANGRN